MRIDHVVYGAQDLDAAAARLEAEHGLTVAGGGVHPSWGTGNVLFAVGDRQYLEVLAVVDPSVEHPVTRLLPALVATGDRPVAICLRPGDLAQEARRLELSVANGERRGADGQTVRWRLAGFEQAWSPDRLPFFIDWGAASPFDAVQPQSGLAGVAWAEMSGGRSRVTDWIGSEPDWLRLTDGPPGVGRIALRSPAGEIVIGPHPRS